jgi:hypothetical protein
MMLMMMTMKEDFILRLFRFAPCSSHPHYPHRSEFIQNL